MSYSYSLTTSDYMPYLLNSHELIILLPLSLLPCCPPPKETWLRARGIPLTEVNTGELLASWTMLLGYEEYPPLTPHGGEI